MKTDKQIYKIFAAYPNWLFELTGLDSPGESTLQALTVKELEQNADGVLIPKDPNEPLTVVEFQFQEDPTIYARTAIEMASLQKSHDMRKIRGVIFFRYRSLDPKTEPWCHFIHTYRLREVLKAFEAAHPDHPLVAVFQPVLLSNKETLEKHAAEYYRTITESQLDDTLKTTLVEVFVNWLEQRLKNKGKQEIEKMLLGDLPDLRDTQSGKDLIKIGETEKAQKILIRQLERRWGKMDPELKRRIRKIESIRKLDSLLDQVVEVDSLEDMKW